MKSTMLAIVITMVISALYSFQNIDTITVNFLFFSKSFPQGVWEVVLFCAGTIMMWLFSLLAGLETRYKHQKQINELNKKIQLLEENNREMIASISVAKAAQDAEPKGSENKEAEKFSSTADDENKKA